jgi:hypothetical protein
MSSKIKKMEFQKHRVSSCSNRLIELNEKMLILKRFIGKKKIFVGNSGKKLTLQVTNEECHIK